MPEPLCPPTEFSDEFVEYMRNRMVVSFHKYGPVADAYPHKVSALDSLQKRLAKYLETGNTEWLVDAANFCMIEFMRPSVPGAEFRATDSDASPGRVAAGGKTTWRGNSELE
jgi:hypothetical protein